MKTLRLRLIQCVLIAGVLTTLAHGQATRTWISGVGDDANPCSRTAPCKTFAGAISKTASGGEISVLDPGGFGGVTITKSITLVGDGTLAGILVVGTNGVTINASGAVVTLRNLSLNGIGLGLNGISFLNGAQLIVENVSIYGFTQSGINVAPSDGGTVVASNVSITGGTSGVLMSGTTGSLNVTLSNISVKGTVDGVNAQYGTTQVKNSVIAQNTGVGLLAESGAVITAEGNLLAGNATAAQAGTGSTVRLSNNDVFDNLAGFGCGGGTLASAGNNRKGGNVGGGGSVCAPNATINMQ